MSQGVITPTLPVCKMSMESMGSLDNVHGLPGHCPRNQWKVWTKSMDTLDKVQGAHSDWIMSMDSFDTVHCLSRQCPWTPWTMSMDLVESLNNVHGYSEQSPGSPLRLDNVHGLSGKWEHCPLVSWIMSRQTGQCYLNPWSPWTLSMDKVHSFS